MKSITEFKNYMKESVKECLMATWDLSNGDQIYFKKSLKKPHIVSPEPVPGKRNTYGDYGYEAVLNWEEAYSMLAKDNQFEETRYEV